MITYNQLGRHGNTGNSMFQFAALVGASKWTGHPFGVPLHESYYDVNYQCNNCSIFDGFDINCHILSADDQKLIKHEYQEPHFHFSPEIKKIRDWTNLSGYYQSEKYFLHATDTVASHFEFKEQIKHACEERMRQDSTPEPVLSTAVHIRRGDFLAKSEFHPQQDLEYYKQACKITRTPYYVFFSDDIEWCKQTFGEHDKIHYSTATNPFEDMYHMSLCSNHVISNSTFGWWGAWLAERKDIADIRRIVAPKLWFGPAHAQYDPKDIIPDRWIKI